MGRQLVATLEVYDEWLRNPIGRVLVARAPHSLEKFVVDAWLAVGVLWNGELAGDVPCKVELVVEGQPKLGAQAAIAHLELYDMGLDVVEDLDPGLVGLRREQDLVHM